MKEVWPRSLQKVNLVEPSQSMQRAGQGLTRGNIWAILAYLFDVEELTLLETLYHRLDGYAPIR